MSSSYIKGKYIKSYFTDASGFIIGLFKINETNDESLENQVGKTITFKGYFHGLNDIDTYIFYGSSVYHNKYGRQFKVNRYERVKREGKNAIVEFLASGIFKGIGDAKAKRIVDVLGDDTLKIILNNPDNLLLIPTINKNNVKDLHDTLKEYESSYKSIIKLNEIGFSTRDASIIYNHYKSNTMKVIDKDIYRLVDDIYELYFKKVDYAAMNMGVKRNDLIRIKASIVYIMREVSNSFGHSYYNESEIYNYLPKVLGISIDEDLFNKGITALEKDSRIVIKEDRYYLKEMYDAETFIVKRFRMLNKKKDKEISNLDNIVNKIEKKQGIKYNEQQRLAIKRSTESSFLIITGGPGTGKTTIMKGIIEAYRLVNNLSYDNLEDEIALLAPTGRAAKRISEATGQQACTIHRFLKWNRDNDTFQVNEYHKSKVNFVIIDEASMIDTYLMSNLLKGISSKCKIVLIGDDNQLPSVGPGQVLHDLISSECLNVIFLEKLYRQGKDSNIISFAYDIRNKSVNREIFNKGDDLHFIECDDRDVIYNICEVANSYSNTNYKNFQILAPMYRGPNGIDSINRSVQNIFNPKDASKHEKNIGEFRYREGDKVIQLTNRPDDNVYNGDLGVINYINNSRHSEVFIDFDGNRVKYTPTSFTNFRQAYCISIHKSQGSEFDVVIIPVIKPYHKMLYQKLIYTGVTRAKKKLYLVGDYDALVAASKNDQNDLRRTTIKEYLINGIK